MCFIRGNTFLSHILFSVAFFLYLATFNAYHFSSCLNFNLPRFYNNTLLSLPSHQCFVFRFHNVNYSKFKIQLHISDTVFTKGMKLSFMLNFTEKLNLVNPTTFLEKGILQTVLLVDTK